MFARVCLLGAAGGFGTISRYALSSVIHRTFGNDFPWGTMVVNVAGCIVAGMFWACSEYHFSISQYTRSLILIGFFGAFTTFSSLMLESAQLARTDTLLLALKNIALQNVLGAIGLAGGIIMVRFLR